MAGIHALRCCMLHCFLRASARPHGHFARPVLLVLLPRPWHYLLPHGLPGGPLAGVQLEVDATLRAEGRGLRLDFQQLSGVLRLRQD